VFFHLKPILNNYVTVVFKNIKKNNTSKNILSFMPEPLKNLYTPAYVQTLASALHEVVPAFTAGRFVSRVFDADWEQRELKQRMRHIAECLRAELPGSYRDALAALHAIADRFTGFLALIFPDFVERYGQDDPDASLAALEYFTQFSSAEFAIRPFIRQEPERVMKQMARWAQHENHHVRRLASEGCRPRLPWAMALPEFKKDPSPVLPILEQLKNDESEYVRRSVANNLNDIVKDHPSLVLDIARRWLGQSEQTDKLVRHACRTLLKRGNTEALALFGFQDGVEVLIGNLVLSPGKIAIGEKVTFEFDVTALSEKPLQLRIEYGVDFVKANGTRSRKIFRVTENMFSPGKTVHIRRAHSFRDLTTRKHYAGRHGIAILVNGKQQAEAELLLTAEP
jgi:3-methyladenine DNA glycosylase AlkC